MWALRAALGVWLCVGINSLTPNVEFSLVAGNATPLLISILVKILVRNHAATKARCCRKHGGHRPIGPHTLPNTLPRPLKAHNSNHHRTLKSQVTALRPVFPDFYQPSALAPRRASRHAPAPPQSRSGMAREISINPTPVQPRSKVNNWKSVSPLPPLLRPVVALQHKARRMCLRDAWASLFGVRSSLVDHSPI